MARRAAVPGGSADGSSSPRDSDKPDADRDLSETQPTTVSRPPSSRRTRRPSSLEWSHQNSPNDQTTEKGASTRPLSKSPSLPAASVAAGRSKKITTTSPAKNRHGSWSISKLALLTAILGLVLLGAILRSLVSWQLEPKGCRMSYMRPSYIHYHEFDTEHTRFATKYSLYLYREQGFDDEHKLRGVPVLFIPGNAGSYKQVRPIAAEASSYFYEQLQHDGSSVAHGIRNLDFFTIDFNEDITAFHGQTLLDQAEYLNEAVRFILTLYSDPARTARDADLPDPSSVIIVGHSMGGVVARTMLIQPNYQLNSINTIITMSAPHARPPVTFDGQIVQIYDEINDYWRQAYAQKWASNNPLWHVTLVSIAGGSLDTVVPSDYASLESIVPETHGFTVYTTGIPTVWTSADHQAILWCDQFRKVVSRALYDIVDVNRASQTRPRAERMRTFVKHFLTGLEANADKPGLQDSQTTLLTLDDTTSTMVTAGERLVLRSLGSSSRSEAHLLPIPRAGQLDDGQFSLLSNSALDASGGHGQLEVLLCSTYTSQTADGSSFAATIHLAENDKATSQFLCKNAEPDSVLLPASMPFTKKPFYLEHEPAISPFSYLQYKMSHLAEYQFIAVINKAGSATNNFVVAEFSGGIDSSRVVDTTLGQLLMEGITFELPADRPVSVDVLIPAMQSSLLAFNLQVQHGQCERSPLFSTMLRQHLDQPHESKFFVNVENADISLHGIAPYMPPALEPQAAQGIALQFWSDPTCHTPLSVEVRFDAVGSLGKLYMRYRTVFAAFPLLIVTLILRKQFRVYDETGTFIPFSEGLDMSLRRSIPLLLLSMTLLSASIGGAPYIRNGRIWNRTRAVPHSEVDFHRNDLLIGTDDPFFTIIVPIIGLVCVGVCTALHYMILAITKVFSILYGLLRSTRAAAMGVDAASASLPVIAASTPRRRMLSTAILLFLVSTFIPYQFAYLVACLVQLFTSVRALRILTVSPSVSNANYYHYCHSILLLMMWVLPINLPILAVWIRNLAVHWLTPFSSHHNVLSIMPFILLVENLTTGRMVPQISSSLRHVTSIFLFCTALCAALYGVSHAYMLHYLVNIIAAWLVILHATSNTWSLASISAMFEGNAHETRKPGKAA